MRVTNTVVETAPDTKQEVAVCSEDGFDIEQEKTLPTTSSGSTASDDATASPTESDGSAASDASAEPSHFETSPRTLGERSPAVRQSWADFEFDDEFTEDSKSQEKSLRTSDPTDKQLACTTSADAKIPPPEEWAGKTSAMLRNLPEDLTQQTLLAEVNQSGFKWTFDFLHLPIDKGHGRNKGYAFVNFSDAAVAWRFKLAYDGRKMSHCDSDKIVSVMPAVLQGFDANYANSRLKKTNSSCRPLFFRRAPRSASKAARPAGRVAPASGPRKKGPGRLEHMAETQRRERLLEQAGHQLAWSNWSTWSPAAEGATHPVLWSWQQAETMEQPSTTNEGASQHFCLGCGSQAQPGFQFCPNCGVALS